jgi:hypothetical protein
MKPLIPSLTHLVRATTDTLRRFPVSTSAALLATGCLIILIAQEAQGPHPLGRVAVAALIGIPVGLAFQLRAEYQGMGGWKRVAMAVAPVALVAAYAFTLPSSLEAMLDDSHHGYRFAQLFIVSHLLAAFLPVGGAAFWRMNKTFFLRILLAALYSFVLQIGLSLSLLSLRMLFGLDVDPKMYAYLFVTVSTTFNTLFFLGGVPKREELDADVVYPSGLKAISQYLLVPIVLLYGLILYAYMGRILIDWAWPEGWVTWLVIGYSVSGILAFLLVHPLLDDAGNPWVRLLSKWYFPALIPLSFLQMLAVWERISTYGVTENRYLAITTGFWLLLAIGIMIRTKAAGIRWIPATLAGVMIVTMAGPWSLFSVSERSQRAQLDAILSANGIMERPIGPEQAARLDSASVERARDIIRYLVRTHSPGSVAGLIADSTLATIRTDSLRHWDAAQHIVNTLGLDRIDADPKRRLVRFLQPDEAIPTGGYAFMAHASINPSPGSGDLRVIGADTLRYDAASSSFSFGGYTADLYGIEWKATDRPSVKVGPVSVLFISAWIVDGRLESADVAVLHD